ncbi:dihydrolipoyl dehydrogenase [Halalkalibacterium halodurans]|uniref:Dihydrolipoyl dehydrogenase n=1 Tax=Halalkalibacterium halodurans (strain ATCC BAA-125 / DSM 18197 / FERM 7344 / JCM 9153 / C-125) TaxID=272558 RepID=Q9KBU9_HALH5|nr:dihydrolipoyl dehydrogenase [Halalkalibacterium halodurans]MED4124987.1 dihydrolipoyl dehydrogenase [Halalkalibacterium halodurans]MED4171822.1 dihydrolipoyl dehydrogenase [Halalkalibacterium halodurans]BAB05544.1 acetoin dehydrogenase E3 component (dihydrolipoamide dehydroge) [Halalkalibacterium halodurans C-125]
MDRVAIVGGGPAGYVAAITAAHRGKQVTLIEQKKLGGTCLNEGCMPTKSLLESAATYDKVKHASDYGIKGPVDEMRIEWGQVQARKNQIVHQLVKGIDYLLKKHKIELLEGTASFQSAHELLVQTERGQQTIEANRIIIATGSEPTPLPFAPFDREWVISSEQAMSLPIQPESMIIVGGGVIGCEFASIYGRMGTKVTIIEMADRLLFGEDHDICKVLMEELKRQGVEIYPSTVIKEMQRDRKQVVVERDGQVEVLTGDYVLVAIGRKPRLQEIGLERIGVDFTSRGITVNEHMQTTIPHIYACGDVIGGIQLAHVAFHEGSVAAKHLCGEPIQVRYEAVPRCIYTSPEIATVGLTETQARENYGHVRIGEYPFAANGKALIVNETIGKVKVVVEPEYEAIVGLTIVGPHATELIAQGTLMVHNELTLDSLESFIAAHPTVSEAVHEAVLQALGQAVHV